MNSINRRVFIVQVAVSGAALAATRIRANAKKLTNAEPQAMALGYREVSKTVDGGKQPNHSATQTCKNCKNCKNCMILKGTGPEGGTCHLFNARLLAGNGWCSHWGAKG